jgi:hypothetical protein
MMKRFTFRPSEIKNAVQHEHWSHKARIVGFSVLMSSIAGYYQYYFDMLVYRSNQYQMAALAGEPGFEFQNAAARNNAYNAAMWAMRHNQDVMEDVSLKELKQIQMNWKTGSYEDAGNTVYTNPNGNPKDNVGYYTQKEKFYDYYSDASNMAWDEFYSKDPIALDADKYDDWAEMHKDVMWFDTAACWKGSFIGNVNSISTTPNASVNIQYAEDPLAAKTITPANDA